MQAVGASRRIFALLDAKPASEIEGGDTLPAGTLVGALTLVDVAFSYPSRPDVSVLNGLSFSGDC